MIIHVTINGVIKKWNIHPGDILLKVLRREGLLSIKSGGCSYGECGACTILLDGNLVNSCTIFAAQTHGHSIETVEAIGEKIQSGWQKTRGLHPIQQAFIETGAIQCGYCTPAFVLAAKSILDKNPNPSEEEIREGISGILCRCTGYKKPVEAILIASRKIRGVETGNSPIQAQKIIHSNNPTGEKLNVIGKPAIKVDAHKLVQGKPAFTDDVDFRDLLVAKVLYSPIAHARIVNIDTTKAKELPGVVSILTWKDIPRQIYSTAGQSDPIPGPLDTFSLDTKVRFVGDRVAFIAAETEEIANHALKLIKVEYEAISPILDSNQSMSEGVPIIHDEPEYVSFDHSDPSKNVAAKIRIDIGNPEEGFSKADRIFEATYVSSKVQQAHIEPHITITYWDEDDRLVIRSSTQVPFHVRRILSPVLGLPLKRIRVIKPRIGGGFGGKQEILIEDVAAHLTIATGRPVRYELTREEEFIAARSRHPMKIRMKTGVRIDGTITANEMYCLSDTGAYGGHALTVTGNTGHKSMALYVGDGEFRKTPNIRFYADVVYTNHTPSGAFRGYGVPQGFWAVERHMEKIAHSIGMDPIEFRLKNAIRVGEMHPFSMSWSEGREPKPEYINTVGLEECVRQGKSAIKWDEKYNNPTWKFVEGKSHLRRGIGLAFAMQGTAIPYLDMGGASIKLNEDGSFNLLVGATDLGTGSDTVLAQMAAEVLGVPLEDMIVYSSDTDFTPFDKGAYASSTTYISGTAVVNAAKQVSEKIRQRAVKLLSKNDPELSINSGDIILKNRKAIAPRGESVSIQEIALASLHHFDQEQIMAVASYMSPVSPPPFAVQFAEVLVDIETGKVAVEKLVMAVDSGVIINPSTASGQIEGGMAQALGYGVCEEMRYDDNGNPLDRDFINYHIFRANEMPELETIFVETYEPSHPFGVKAVAEIPMDGVAPAVANAIYNACGAQIDEIPLVPQRVWQAIQEIQEK